MKGSTPLAKIRLLEILGITKIRTPLQKKKTEMRHWKTLIFRRETYFLLREKHIFAGHTLFFYQVSRRQTYAFLSKT